ncbi:hypothetical protein Tco_0540614, partial [Tanacetum coccineum]
MSIDEELAQKVHEEEQTRFNAEHEAKFKAEQEQERLDHEIAMKTQEELDAAERQRMAQVHQATQGFTDDEWDDILARVTADKDFVQQLQAAKRNKPMTPAQQKEYMYTYIKNQEGCYTLKQLKALSFEEVKEIFNATMRKVQSFVPMDSETEEASGSVQEQTGEEPKAEELSQEQLHQMMMVIPVEDSRKYWKITRVGGDTEAYQTFDDMLKKFDRDDLDKLWNLVKERFRTTKPTEDQARELWLELKRLFEPDDNDTLWKLQRYMHDPLKWWLYDTCGVHYVSTKRGHDIYMLVEKDYPLTKALMTLMLCNKLRVDQYSDMAEELLKKIFILVERPRHLGEDCWELNVYTLSPAKQILNTAQDITNNTNCIPSGSLQLVNEALAKPSISWSNIDEENLEVGERNVKQCKRKICDGHYTTTVRVLSSSGVAPYNDATLKDLKAKHPPKPSPSCHIYLLITINSLHLMVYGVVVDIFDELVSFITQVVNLFLDGKCPKMLGEYIASASLTPLVKPGGGISPIAVVTIWRRLVFKVSAAMISHSLDGYLNDLQFGVGVSGGGKAILHAVNCLIEDRGDEVGLSSLLVDYRNAFNLVDHEVMLQEVRIHCPAISRWVEFCYSTPAILYNGEHTLSKIRDSFNLFLQAWYLDDGTVIGDTLIVGEVLKDPRSRFTGVFPPNIARPLHGVKLLGGPSSANFDFSSELVMKTVAKSSVLVDTVAKLNDPSVSCYSSMLVQ